ncbi:MAG: type II toxin-antitoxin system VapC family toxin [Bacteroidales bacterium]|nr:type II toxin-antitoxin system VapC family toxin [Bacteroidales bacterium]
MRVLIDTQAFIWFVENDRQLPGKIKEELENSENTIIISIASLWEMTIKMSLNKLEVGCGIEEMVEKVYRNGFEILPILPNHIIKLSTLRFIHRDPFDRIIISQGLSEDLPIVTSDRIFEDYGIRRKWEK